MWAANVSFESRITPRSRVSVRRCRAVPSRVYVAGMGSFRKEKEMA